MDHKRDGRTPPLARVMGVGRQQLQLLQFAFNSVYVDLKYNEISLTFTAWSMYLCGVCGHVVGLPHYKGSWEWVDNNNSSSNLF